MLELSEYIYVLYYEVVYDSRLFNRCNGWQHGIGIAYDYDLVGRLWNGYMDKPHGIEICYYSNGSISVLRYWRNGTLHGMRIDYRQNSSTRDRTRPTQNSINRVIHWRNGKRHGIEFRYRTIGYIDQLEYWQHGKKIEIQNLY